jgi:hypothetical protein
MLFSIVESNPNSEQPELDYTCKGHQQRSILIIKCVEQSLPGMQVSLLSQSLLSEPETLRNNMAIVMKTWSFTDFLKLTSSLQGRLDYS